MKLKLFAAFVLILALSVLSYRYLSAWEARTVSDLSEQHMETMATAYRAIVDTYRVAAEKDYYRFMSEQDVLDLLKRFKYASKKEQNLLRGMLYRRLYPQYETMRSMHFRQFHLHTHDGRSLLRMHLPYENDDDLIGVRHTIRSVNREHRPVYGLEGGRVYVGYRFLFPIEADGDYLGSVEFSIAFEGIAEKLRSILPDRTYQLLLTKNISYDKVFAWHRDIFVPDSFGAGYYEENPEFSAITRHTREDARIREMIRMAVEQVDITRRLQQHASFSIPLTYKGSSHIITFLSVTDTKERHGGYLVSYSEMPEITETKQHYNMLLESGLFLAVLLLGTVGIIIIQIEKTRAHRKVLERLNGSFATAQAIAHLGSWDYDHTTRLLQWSDELYRILGLDPRELVPTYDGFLDFIHPEDRDMVDRSYREGVETDREFHFRHRIVRPDGSIRFVDQRVTHEFDRSGRFIASRGTLRDITDEVFREREIEAVRNELHSIVEHIPDIIYRCRIDETWGLVYLNHRIRDITGYPAETFLTGEHRPLARLIHPEDRAATISQIEDAVFHHEAYDVEYRMMTAEGGYIWAHEHGEFMPDRDGRLIRQGIISDITSQKEAYHRLERFIDIQDTIVVLTDGSSFTFANRKFFDFFGHENLESFKKEHECICERFLEQEGFFSLADVKPDEAHWIESLLHLSGRQRIVTMLDKTSTPHAFSVSINRYNATQFVIDFADISDTMFEKLQLQRQVIHDPLTGAYNRNYFDKSITALMQMHRDSGSETGLIYFDIDYFKRVNDTYGHAVGDAVLQQIVLIINAHSRDSDKLVRWGGEEFLMVVPTRSLTDLEQQAENLRRSIEENRFESIAELTCSFGVTVHQPEEAVEETVKRADRALYDAKARGRNRVIGL